MEIRKLRKMALEALFPYGSIQTIHAGDCRGMKFRVTRETGHSMLAGYEGQNQKFLKTKLSPEMTVYDIGANCGQMSLFFARRVPKGKVIAFEPVLSLYEQALGNLRINGLKNTDIHPWALGSEDGTRSLYYNSLYPSMGQIDGTESNYNWSKGEKMDVAVRRMDSIIGSLSPPQLMKIDTEGAAGSVLGGGIETLRRFMPKLFIELHNAKERDQTQQVLSKLHYRSADLSGKRIENLASSDASPIWVESE